MMPLATPKKLPVVEAFPFPQVGATNDRQEAAQTLPDSRKAG